MTLKYVCLICITIASFHCLRIRLSHIISTLYEQFAYGIHYITMLLLLEQFMYFVVYYLMLILSLISRGMLDSLCKAFTLPVFVYFFIYAQINKYINNSW